jgi:hypothetical protein
MMMKTIMEVHQMNNWMIRAGHYDSYTKDLFLKETKHFNKYRTVVPWSLEGLSAQTEHHQQTQQAQTSKHLLYTPKDPEYRAITLGHFLSCKYQSLLLLGEDKLIPIPFSKIIHIMQTLLRNASHYVSSYFVS